MIRSPATVPIILGISLISVGGACVYAFLKKRKERLDEIPGEDSFSKIAKFVRMMSRDDSKVLEIQLSNNIVPLVIGRKGYTIKHIQECTKTEICFRQKDELHQICEISGTADGVRKAEKMIMKEATRQVMLTEEIIVPQSACGKILGRCGDALEEICRQSMAKVWIEGTRSRGESRRVMITGTQEQIKTAKSLIEQKVRDDNECRKSQEKIDLRREPRIRTPPSSVTATPIPREVLPPTVEKLKSTSSTGQLEVFVSAVVSPSRFYLQLVGPQSAELDILVETMTEYYNRQENRQLHAIRKPYLGQIVAAEFNADSKWYRAEIVAILPNEFKPEDVVLDLYFVDYGDNQYIQPADVYELRPDFLALRFQAVECFLAHVEPITATSSSTGDDDWDPAAITRFEELTHAAQWNKLLSRIATYKNKKHRGTREGREGSPIPGVELYDTTADGADINIALELINEGYAKMVMKLGDLSRSHVLRVDGGSRTTSSEKLNDNSSGSTTGSISSVMSSINPNKTMKRENASDEPHSNKLSKLSRTNAQFLEEEKSNNTTEKPRETDDSNLMTLTNGASGKPEKRENIKSENEEPRNITSNNNSDIKQNSHNMLTRERDRNEFAEEKLKHK